MIAPSSMTEVRPRMGTLLAATLVTWRADVRARALRTIFDVVAACERLMSAHDPVSDLSRLNRMAGRPSRLCSPELARILERCQALSAATEGAFDPTVGALRSLWRRASRRGRLPSPRELGQAWRRVGWRMVDVSGAEISLAQRGTTLDLGGFGKGLALDRVTAALRGERFLSGLLNFGESSLVTVGLPRRQWPIALRHPLGGFAGEFVLSNRACSTSATFGQAATIDGRVIGHILDPRTGRPVRRLAQVTVLARAAAAAEALSTALLVLGREAIDSLARRLGAEVCWIDSAGVHTTPGFTLKRLGVA